MAALKNTKHERFAQARVQGKGIAEAFEAAGYSPNPGNAGRLNNNEHVQARIAELMEGAAEKTKLSKAWVIDRLIEVAERCMQAEPVLNRKGEPALVETPTGSLAPAYTFNAAGANRALELLGKEEGMFVDRTEATLTHKHEESLDEVRAAIERRRQERMNGDGAVH